MKPLPYFFLNGDTKKIFNYLSRLYGKTKVRSSRISSKKTINPHECREILENIKQKYFYRCDIAKYYPNISHEILVSELRCHYVSLVKPTLSKRYTHFLDIFLPEFLQRSPYHGKGIPIGSSLSRILADLYLMRLDQQLESEKVIYLRYVDDIVIFANSQKHCEEVIRNIITPTLQYLQLELNISKTSFGKIHKDSLFFLGYAYVGSYQTIAKEKITLFREKILRITDLRTKNIESLLIKKINNLIYGFGHYYKDAHCMSAFITLDSYIRARVRRKLSHTKSNDQNRINNLIYDNRKLKELGLKSLADIKDMHEKCKIKKQKPSKNPISLAKKAKPIPAYESGIYTPYLLYREIQELKSLIVQLQKNLGSKKK